MKTQCPHCKTIVNAPTDSVGRKAKCPKCERPFRIAPVQTDESLNDAELRQSPPAKGNHAVKDSSAPVSRNESRGKQNSNTCPNCGQMIDVEASLLTRFARVTCVLLTVLAIIGWGGWLVAILGDAGPSTRMSGKLDLGTNEVSVENDTTVFEAAISTKTTQTDVNEDEMGSFLKEFAPLINEFHHMARLFRVYGMNIKYEDYMTSLMKIDACLPSSTPPDNDEARRIMKCAQTAVESFRKGKGVFVSEKLGSLSDSNMDERMEDLKEAGKAWTSGLEASIECMNLWAEAKKKYDD